MKREKIYIGERIRDIKYIEKYIEEPLIITRKNGIKCFSNVCTHRGHLVCNKKNNGKSMVCRYHGRSFNLNGKFRNATGVEGVKNFPSNSDNLASIDIKEWKKFILVESYGDMIINKQINIQWQ